MAAEKKPSPQKSARAGSGNIALIAVAVVALLAAGGAGLGWYQSSSRAAAAEQAAAKASKNGNLPAQALYFALEPPFVVNLDGDLGPRYLQVEVQLMTRDPVARDNLERHAPAIRAKLLMLFAQQTVADIANRAGKEKLQAQALAEVQKLMRVETGDKGVEALLFTSFVTQ